MDNQPPTAWSIVSARYMSTFIMVGALAFLGVVLFFQEKYSYHTIKTFAKHKAEPDDAVTTDDYDAIIDDITTSSTFTPIAIMLLWLFVFVLAIYKCGFPGT